MVRHSIDCLFLLPGSNFTWLTGLKFVRERYRLMAALLTKEGRFAIMGASFEEAKMGSGPLPAEVCTWTDEENQHRIVARWIEKASGSGPRIGFDSTANY